MKRLLPILLALGAGSLALFAATKPTTAPVHGTESDVTILRRVADYTQRVAEGSPVATKPTTAPVHGTESTQTLLRRIADYTQDAAENGGGVSGDQTANTVYAGPAVAPAAAATFRALVDADIPAAIARDTEITAALAARTIAIPVVLSDETTDLTTGTAKITFRMPYAFTLTAVRANVNTAPTGSTIIVDINESGSTIMTTTKLSIDASEKTSTTAASAAALTDTALADDAELTFDIDQIGSTIAGKGLKVWLIGTK